MTREQIEELAKNPFGNLKRHKEVLDLRMAAYDQWEAQCRVIDDQYRVGELEQISIAECDAFTVIEDKIYETPANSIEGILVKLIAWREYQCPSDINCVSRFVDSALEDAKRISGQIGGQHV